MFEFPDGEYWVYLRKSRADIEAEARGEGETLSKHKKTLLSFAKDNKLNITRIYQEVESGESIIHRPEMVKILKDMEETPPAGVLVMDIDRLGRGDKIDQGIIEQAFKETFTLIVTPSGTFDMNDENGEFNVEMRTFLARIELKQTTKRLQGGRIRSVQQDRNYLGTRPPYGYLIHKDKEGRTLIPHPEQADVVRQIFYWYTNENPEQRLGSNKIANELNNRSIPTYTGRKPWDASSVLTILKNEVYTGRIQWGKTKHEKSKVAGKRRKTSARPREKWIDVEGRHQPLISKETYLLAQEILKTKYHVPYQLVNGITNPLAGLIRCAKCGSSMVYRPYTSQPAHLKCYKKGCDNKSSRFEYVERALIVSLTSWLDEYEAEWKKYSIDTSLEDDARRFSQTTLNNQLNELRELELQKSRLFDLLERGTYDEETFLMRSVEVSKRIEEIKICIEESKLELERATKKSEARKNFVPKIKKVIQLYPKANAAEKNALLKSVIAYATYNKERTQRNDEFTLDISPRLG